MKQKQLVKHLIDFITSKSLRDEANKYIEDIEAGNTPEAQGDKLSQLPAGPLIEPRHLEFPLHGRVS